jgi:Cdc6-like AAA superfamily ATPase
MVLGLTRSLPEVGLEAHFLRRLPDSKKVEVTLRDDRLVLHASKEILGAEESGTMKRGAPLLISPTREFAFRCLPTQEDKRYRYVDTEKIPDIEISRDIGKPHWVLGWLIRRMRILLDRPDILERFDLRPRFSVMMTGPTGVGKTLHIKAFLCEFRRMLEKRTGLTDLGSRVIRIKTSDLLSEFLGRSDKQIDELFDDIYQLASEKVESAQGELLVLPIVVVLEEVEALGRRRGAHDGAVYDRIIGTILQRLDDPTDDLGRLPIMLISTSNRPDLADPAILRRLGFLRANFTRLESEDLAAILSKKLKENYLYNPQDGLNEDQIRPHLIDRVVSWFFNSNGSNPGIVEVVLRDGSRIVKHRRDFLSGALVEQAVSNSIDQMAFSMEESGDDRDIGFTAESLIESFRRQVDSLAESLTAWNAADHLDLPEHSLVASVNRLPGLYSRPAAVLAENQWPEQEQKTDQKTTEEIHE